ncbi:MAG: Uma2 family endonuclease [Chloroflexota bacterium]|nr:Uma2 family endonuclease [Chloroflexota bacterium]MDE2909516.1 Uma2 family endonuclease [Chloroflexota bacterium]
MAANPRHYWTAEEFLAFEADSEFKHELIDGEVYDMSGGTGEHSQIAANIIFSLISLLETSSCRVNTSDMMLKVRDDRYLYPDVSVVCGQPEYEDDSRLALVNPTLVVEVTSPSSAEADRGSKRESYMHLPSVQAYLVIDQHRIYAELYERAAVGWRMQVFTCVDDVISIAALDIKLPLASIFRGISFYEGTT